MGLAFGSWHSPVPLATMAGARRTRISWQCHLTPWPASAAAFDRGDAGADACALAAAAAAAAAPGPGKRMATFSSRGTCVTGTPARRSSCSPALSCPRSSTRSGQVGGQLRTLGARWGRPGSNALRIDQLVGLREHGNTQVCQSPTANASLCDWCRAWRTTYQACVSEIETQRTKERCLAFVLHVFWGHLQTT